MNILKKKKWRGKQYFLNALLGVKHRGARMLEERIVNRQVLWGKISLPRSEINGTGSVGHHAEEEGTWQWELMWKVPSLAQETWIRTKLVTVIMIRNCGFKADKFSRNA